MICDAAGEILNTAMEKWEKDVGAIYGDHWTEALESVRSCSLNVTQRLSQLYLLLRVHLTPLKLFTLGLHPDPLCAKCSRDYEIRLLWSCPKLHWNWTSVIHTINSNF